MEEAFKVLVKSKIKNKNVLLIDDVYTTGATFNSLSNTLKKCGAKNVYGLSLAHTKMEDIIKVKVTTLAFCCKVLLNSAKQF